VNDIDYLGNCLGMRIFISAIKESRHHAVENIALYE